MDDLIERLRAAVNEDERTALATAMRKVLYLHSGPHSCGFSDYDDADPCGTLLALAEGYGIEVEA